MSKKKRSITDGLVEMYLYGLLAKKPDAEFQRKVGPFPHDLRVVGTPGGSPLIIEVVNATATVITPKAAAGKLRSFVQYCCTGDMVAFNVGYPKCRVVVDSWSNQGFDLPELPKPMAFKSDPELCMTRLDFDPAPVGNLEELRSCAPTFATMIDRVENRDAFCMRLGSIFDPIADRKQAVWMSGPQDSAKSDFAWLVQQLSGRAYGLLNNAEFRTPYWKAQLLGKRVGIVNEAATHFIRSDEFKSITGDEEHAINQKNQPIFNAKLPVLIFFFSNNPPEIPHDEALILRIIDCRIRAIEGKTIPRATIHARLQAEMPFIAGYCLARYATLDPGSRIPCERETLTDSIDAYEAHFLDFIEHNFIKDEGAHVMRSELYEAMNLAGIKDGEDQKKCKELLFRRYGCSQSRPFMETNAGENARKRIFIIKGIRFRNEAERQFIDRDNLLNPRSQPHGRQRFVMGLSRVSADS